MKLIVAVYGSELAAQNRANLMAQFWQWSLWESAQRRLPLTHVGASFEKPVKRFRSDRLHWIASKRKAIREQLSQGSITGLELVTMKSEPSGDVACRWDWAAACNVDPGNGSMIILGVDCHRMRAEVGGIAVRYAELISRWKPTEYGFAATMDDDNFPFQYALGAGGGWPADDMLRLDAVAWFGSAISRCAESLRNVFGYNVLSAKHLDIDVGGRRLADWIAAKLYRGRIEPQANGQFLWTFQQRGDEGAFLYWEHPAVAHVRRELMEYGLFAWQPMLEELLVNREALLGLKEYLAAGRDGCRSV